MDTRDDSTAKVARSLQTFFERRQAVKRAELINQKPQLQVTRPATRHQRVDRCIKPQRQQL